ncbi:MAG TPA: transcriptional regulator [Micromonospora sp.]|nr:transcriptional regulator [Micromonospora sp.]
MRPAHTPDAIARYRTVTAAAVLEGRVDLRSYPYRHLAVLCQGVGGDRIAQAMAAADLLDRFGWDLVTISELTTSNSVYAFLRRR